jgi:hypothetical protein
MLQNNAGFVLMMPCCMILPRLLLTPLASVWWSNKAKGEFRKRCEWFLHGDWRGLYEDSSAFARADSNAEGLAQSTELKRLRRKEPEAES